MKLQNLYFLLLLLATATITLQSCDKTEVIPDADQVNFQEPIVGQENYYIRYSGPCGELSPSKDTLILRIRAFDGATIELEERFTPGSPSFNQLPYIYSALWSKEMLTIDALSRQFSQLFFFYGSDTLKLKESASTTMHQNNCIVWDGQTDFTGDKIGIVPVFSVADNDYENKKIVSCVPIIQDLDAYLLYDQFNIYSSFTSAAGGWEPMEDPFTNAYALVDISN